MEKIKKDMIDAGKAPRSIQYALAVARQVINHAIRNEIFSGDNPASKVSRPKVDNKRLRFLSHEEADLLLDNLLKRSQQLHDMALLSLHCGPRAGEIFDLTWGCVDLDRDSIVFLDTKSGKNRTVYMTNEVKKMLLSKIRKKPTDLVFIDRKGAKIKEVSNAFGRAVKDLRFNDGIEDPRLKVYFHTLRHTYASWMVQNGESLYTVKELMGHSTLAMTERYSHLAKDNLKNAVKRFEDRLQTETQGKIIDLKPDKI
jgi:integrase